MKLSNRFVRYQTPMDQLSSYLSEFRLQIDYLTFWPEQDHKTLTDIVGTRIKLILQTSGTSEIDTHDLHFDLGPGDCAIIPPYALYSARTHEQVRSYEVFFNIYPIIREQEFLHQFGITKPLHVPSLVDASITPLLAQCYADIQARRPGSYDLLLTLTRHLLVKLIQSAEVPFAAKDISPRAQSLIEKLFAYLDDHLHENVRVEDICREFSISQSLLYRCCRSVMDCSPVQVITRYKLRHAQTLLRNPDLSISEVAAAIGYDPFYFSSQFKKNFFLSPSQYRKELHKV